MNRILSVCRLRDPDFGGQGHLKETVPEAFGVRIITYYGVLIAHRGLARQGQGSVASLRVLRNYGILRNSYVA